MLNKTESEILSPAPIVKVKRAKCQVPHAKLSPEELMQCLWSAVLFKMINEVFELRTLNHFTFLFCVLISLTLRDSKTVLELRDQNSELVAFDLCFVIFCEFPILQLPIWEIVDSVRDVRLVFLTLKIGLQSTHSNGKRQNEAKRRTLV